MVDFVTLAASAGPTRSEFQIGQSEHSISNFPPISKLEFARWFSLSHVEVIHERFRIADSFRRYIFSVAANYSITCIGAALTFDTICESRIDFDPPVC
jgi:hypothetical protein